MFKRLYARLRGRFRKPITLPTNARWVIFGKSGRALVVPPETQVKIMPVQHLSFPIESRQVFLKENPRVDPRKSGRAWLVDHLPDECAFL